MTRTRSHRAEQRLELRQSGPGAHCVILLIDAAGERGTAFAWGAGGSTQNRGSA